MKRAIIGGMLFAIGLTILSPIEEILILVPLSVYWSMPELILVFNAAAILCLIGAVYLLGTSKILGAIHKYWRMLVVSIIVLVIYAYWYLV